jgi:exopolysaccharide production protein ExoQ
MQSSVAFPNPAFLEGRKVEPRVVEAPSRPLTSQLASWVLMVPLIVIASDGVLWFRGSSEITLMSATYGSLAATTSNTADNAVIGGLLLAIIALLAFPRLKALIALMRRDKVFIALAGLLMISCLWSQFPSVTIRWAPVAVINIIFAFYIYQRFSPDQQMRLFLTLGWISLITSLTLAVFLPQYGVDPTMFTVSWRGMYSQKNLFSMATLFFLPAAFCLPIKGVVSAILRIAYVGLSIFAVVMTQSATGKITLACLLAYFLARRLLSQFRAQEKTIAFVVMATMLAALVLAGFSSTQQIAVLLGKDPTLTGRTEIWQTIMPAVLKHPILGYGYVGFWRGYEGESANLSLANGWSVTSAHNGILEIWLDLGIVGVGLVVFALLRAFKDAFVCFRGGNSRYLSWCTCMILLTIVISADEAEFLVASTIMRMLFIIACLGLAEGARRIRLGPVHG